jgi:hypothetical protein
VAPPRHFHAPVSKPVHSKPYVKVPEAQRRPIVNSTPQLHQKPRSFASTPPRAAANTPRRAAASAPTRSFTNTQQRGASRGSLHAKPR